MAESLNRPKDIFLKALDLSSPTERAAFVAQACGDDASLRRQLEAMLQAHATPDSFLEKPAAAMGLTIDDSPHGSDQRAGDEGPGTRVGPYKLLQQLGEGGMGVVFLAEQQEPVRRTVALKIIKKGMDSGQIVARFESERQALALMDHPNIAKVLDAGTTDSGRPYFVMELIKGIPITRFCDQEHLTPRQRLELFIPVCQAVQHAHQKGIIHRDLKPSNVLIALYDGTPVPKVIDFGVAKATSQKLTERTLFTEVGSMVGTLEYMAPEQAELNNLDIDTRADIYALGVLLYELLTGSPPFSAKELRSNAFAEMLRMIREVEPPRPSTRLSSSQELPAIAACRKLEPSNLTRQMQGDLDWIVMKCLEKERSRRYDTANAVALEIQRYLTDEPVLAGPPSAGYRLRKFVKRNRGTVTAVCLVLLTVIAGVVGTSWGWFEALTQRDDAIEARKNEAEQRLAATANENRAHDNELKALASEAKAREEKQRADQEARTAKKNEAQAKENEKIAIAENLQSRRHLYLAQMGQVQLLWESAQMPRLVELLQSQRFERAGDLDLRGWEWHYWMRVTNSHQRVFRVPDNVDKSKILVMAEGKRLIASSENHSAVYIWEPDNGKILQTVRLPPTSGTRLVLSPTGTRVAIYHHPDFMRDKWTAFDVVVYDVPSGKKIQTLKQVGEVRFAAFSPNGGQLITVEGSTFFGVPNQVRIWDLDDAKAHVFLKETQCYEATFSPDATKVLLAYNNSVSKVLDATNGKELFRLEGYYGRFSPDGKLVATKSPESIRLWDAKSGVLVQSLPHANAQVPVFSPNGNWLAAGSSRDATLRVWDVPTGKLRTAIKAGYWPLALSDDGHLIGQDYDGAIKQWDVARCQDPATFASSVRGAVKLAFDPDSRRLAAIGNGIDLWDLRTRQKIRTLKGSFPPYDLSADGKLSANYGPFIEKRFVEIINSESGNIVRAWQSGSGAGKQIEAICFNRDGSLLATVVADGTLTVWDTFGGTAFKEGGFNAFGIAAGKEVVSFAGTSGRHLVFSKDGSTLYAAGEGIHVLNLKTKARRHLKMKHAPVAFAISADERTIAATTGGKTLLWEVESFQLLKTLDPGPTSNVAGIAFHPGGSRLATAGEGGVKMWDLVTGQETLTLAPSEGFFSVAFSRDGNLLAAGSSNDGMIRVWDGTPSGEKAAAKAQ